LQHYLITGGAGFIGSHLAEALLEDGKTVSVVDNLSTGCFENIEHLIGQKQFRFAIADALDGLVLDRLASECDVIVHLAAAVGVRSIIDSPVRTIEVNVTGTEMVLKAARRYRNKVLIASTSEVYGKGCRIPFSEDDDVLLGSTRKSRWSYAASKMVDEFLTLAYHHEHKVPVVIMRLFNTIGPRQVGNYGMVVPRLVSQAMTGAPMTVYDDGLQSRCFCDVRDVVRAIIGLAEHPRAVGQVYNVGSTREITINDLADTVRAVVKSESEIVRLPYDKVYSAGFEDMRRRVPDVSRISELVGWKPVIELEQTIASIQQSLETSNLAWVSHANGGDEDRAVL
jgi:UDP-glucose 4-epimerase